ncbi:hypothetical protein [Spiroplasma taiwanense]|uniref:Uncharacterized protein n=1 Tax=Spiroplasma taiwanense CT-1 TaxID=1276220 RepID=S5LX85_9MOLU|nr:hypothetical protein [Spiroplasma taiwanense]AGR41236.1 hypothetical protein STAIW_v1c06140 [Spiroplasma taiwanense CT-1]
MFVVLFSASILAAVVYLYLNGGLSIANVILMSSVSEAFISLVISSGIYFGQIKNGRYLNK